MGMREVNSKIIINRELMIRLSEIVLLSSQKILKLTALKTKLFILSLLVSANCLAQRTETYISEWQFSRDSMS